MTLTTTETLSIDGTVLNTLGYNVDLWQSTVGAASRSQRHVVVPRRPGAIRRPVQVDPTVVELSMWVSDRDADGVPNGTTQMWSNLDTILAIVGQGSEWTLQKKRQSSGGLLTLDMTVELAGEVAWSQLAPTVVALRVPLVAAYPYWEGASQDETSTGVAGTMTNNGHANADKITLTLEAGGSNWVNPSVENATLGITLDYTGTVTASQTYTINLWEGTAVDNTSTSITGSVDINSAFFSLAPGSNTVNVTQTSGSGTARCVFNPPYLG